MTLEIITKTIWQFHDKKEKLQEAFEYFGHATNEAVRIDDEENLMSQKEIRRGTHHEVEGEFYSRYMSEAVKVTKSKLKLFRTTKKEEIFRER